MELSHYLLIYPCSLDSDHVILFSTKQASKIRIHKDTLASMEKKITPSQAEVLEPLGMAIPDRKKEIQEMTRYFEKRVSNNKALEFILVLNLDCNFACAYCFEEDVKKKAYMSPETANRLIDRIKDILKISRKNLLVDFYGGEPFLSYSMMEGLAKELKSITLKLGRTFGFRIVTNGSLFTRKIVERLVPYGLAGAKITIDGPPDNHNQFRPFKSGADSFDTVLNNIKSTCELTRIEIGGNYSSSNYHRFVELLDILELSGLTPDKIYMVKFDPIFQHTENSLSGRKSDMGCKTINEPWITEADRLLREEILKRGYNTPKPAPLCCMIENPDALVINYNGDFYKCPCFIDVKAYCVGNLDAGIFNYGTQYGLDVWKNSDCLSCKYLPLCFGGCRYMTYIQTGKIEGLACQKEYFDAALETLVMQDIILRDN